MTHQRTYMVAVSRTNTRARVIYATHRGTYILRASFAGKTLSHRFTRVPKYVHLLTVAEECSLL